MTAGPLVVTEVMYNAAAPSAAAAGWKESDFEFVELKNLGSDPLLLTGYALSQGAGYAFGTVTLGAGEYIVVAKNLAAFTSRYGSVANVVGNYSGTLGNGGDDLTLKNPAGTTTLSFTFDDAWYPTTDGSGYSLVIINPQAPPTPGGSRPVGSQALPWVVRRAARKAQSMRRLRAIHPQSLAAARSLRPHAST